MLAWRACVPVRHESGRAAPETTGWRAVGGRLHLLGVGRLRLLRLLDAQHGRAHPLQLRDHLLVVHLARARGVCVARCHGGEEGVRAARCHGGDDWVASVARTFCLRRWQMSRLAASTSVSPTPAAHAIAIIAVSSIGRPAPVGAWGDGACGGGAGGREGGDVGGGVDGGGTVGGAGGGGGGGAGGKMVSFTSTVTAPGSRARLVTRAVESAAFPPPPLPSVALRASLSAAPPSCSMMSSTETFLSSAPSSVADATSSCTPCITRPGSAAAEETLVAASPEKVRATSRASCVVPAAPASRRGARASAGVRVCNLRRAVLSSRVTVHATSRPSHAAASAAARTASRPAGSLALAAGRET